ncbi:tryptophan synthase beta subunit-like PLP-dependent enzyme [Dentipellis sp. KUC8613]|nr:tryptophan synthase beta subunit-like PLP-dependent enzyme [Dentipellis sp. KUC8613]
MPKTPPTSSQKLWIETPLIYSRHLSQRLDDEKYRIYLKLENLQPSQSYKYRGLSLFVQYQYAIHGASLHVICASGGNAGLAAAYAAKRLGVKCTIFFPEGVAQGTRDFLQTLGAELVVAGRFFLEALRAAEEAVENDPNAVLIPAYDNPTLWQGHASMIDEMKVQVSRGTRPDAIVCCVGGGGLLGGLIVGCKNAGWDDVPIIALETHGSNCFYQSILANREPASIASLPDSITIRHDDEHNVQIAHVHNLTSKATSLGATEPSAEVVRMALDRKGGVRCVSIPDELCMQVAELFADDHKMLVELACAATLAPAYKGSLLQYLVPPVEGREVAVAFIVCGGFKISLQDMQDYAAIVAADKAAGPEWQVLVDGTPLSVPK